MGNIMLLKVGRGTKLLKSKWHQPLCLHDAGECLLPRNLELFGKSSLKWRVHYFHHIKHVTASLTVMFHFYGSHIWKNRMVKKWRGHAPQSGKWGGHGPLPPPATPTNNSPVFLWWWPCEQASWHPMPMLPWKPSPGYGGQQTDPLPVSCPVYSYQRDGWQSHRATGPSVPDSKIDRDEIHKSTGCVRKNYTIWD